jgi:hypothetical protein
MKYFPKSRIITNQQSNPGQFTINGEEYNGPYYTTYNGESFTGINPSTGSSIPLKESIPTIDVSLSNPSLGVYNQLNTKQKVTLIDPTPYTPKPTTEDYKIGKITRYIARQKSGTQFKIMEIDKNTHESLTNLTGNSNTSLWKSISIFWQISGPLRNERINNITTRAGIIDTNQRILDNAEKNFIGIKQYLSDLQQFSR